jgi:AraC-like DNA-binding protein
MKQASAEDTTTTRALWPEPPARGLVSIALLRALVEVGQQRGVSAEALLGDDAHLLFAEPAERWLPRARFEALLARALQLTAEPALGLYVGLQPSSASFGVMATLIGHAPSLRRALELTIQFHPLLIGGVRIELAESLGVAQLRCDLGGSRDNRALTEMMVAGLTRTLTSFGCRRDEITAVRVPHARPAYSHAYALIFGGAERFAQDCICVEFSAAALSRPHLHHHAELHQLVLAQAERTLQQIQRPLSFTQRVRALMLDGRPGTPLPDMVVAARELGVSVRSLRRHLEEEGTSFRELTQSQLRETACVMLRNPALTLQGIAFELGFSDVTAFHRAFRRWAGLTPAEYRSEALAAPSAHEYA